MKEIVFVAAVQMKTLPKKVFVFVKSDSLPRTSKHFLLQVDKPFVSYIFKHIQLLQYKTVNVVLCLMKKENKLKYLYKNCLRKRLEYWNKGLRWNTVR